LRLSYYEEEPGRQSAAKILSKDEAKRIAADFAKLPEVVSKPTHPQVLLNRRMDCENIALRGRN